MDQVGSQPDLRIAASKIVRNRKPPHTPKLKSTKALDAILSVKNIEFPTDVQEKYDECRQRPATFWPRAGVQLDLETDSIESTAAFWCKVYLAITGINHRSQWGTITWRFLVIFLHDLTVFFGRKQVTSTTFDDLVLILSSSSSITDTEETILGNLKRWVSSGSRYSLLLELFDGGAPFLLPQSVTSKTWETTLPLKGPLHKTAVDHLITKGICTTSTAIGADVLGREIRDAIMEPFRRGILTFNPNATTSTLHSVLRKQGGLYTYPSPCEVPHTGRSQDNSALMDLRYGPVVQANTNQQLSGQDVLITRHDHSISTRPGHTSERVSLDPAEPMNSALERLIENQNVEDSRNLWDSAANHTGHLSTFSSGGYFSLLNQNTPQDFWNGVYIPPPTPTIPLDFSNGIYIPAPAEPILLNLNNFNSTWQEEGSYSALNTR